MRKPDDKRGAAAQSPATLPRRGLLTAAIAGAGAVAGAPATALAGAGADAELVRLGDAMQAEGRDFFRTVAEHCDEVDGPSEAIEAEQERRGRKMARLAESMAPIDATSPAGLRAKAIGVMAFVSYYADGRFVWDNHGELLGLSIARDLVGIEARPCGDTLHRADIATLPAGADGELLARCQEFFAITAKINAWDHNEIELSEKESTILLGEWYNAMERITASPPAVTAAGRNAKIKVAHLAMTSLDNYDTDREEGCARAVLAELAGRAST